MNVRHGWGRLTLATGCTLLIFCAIFFARFDGARANEPLTEKCKPRHVYKVEVDPRAGPQVEDIGTDARYPKGVVWYKNAQGKWFSIRCDSTIGEAQKGVLQQAAQDSAADRAGRIEAIARDMVSDTPKDLQEILQESALERAAELRGDRNIATVQQRIDQAFSALETAAPERSARDAIEAIARGETGGVSPHDRIDEAFSNVPSQDAKSGRQLIDELRLRSYGPSAPITEPSEWQQFLNRIAPPLPPEERAERLSAYQMRQDAIFPSQPSAGEAIARSTIGQWVVNTWNAAIGAIRVIGR